MSVVAALTEMFACAELTHPVTLGAARARGIYDEAGELMPAGTMQVQVVGPVLFLQKGSLAGLTEQSRITLGEVGAASAAGGREYVVHELNPIQDGQIIACRLGGGR
ncbi:MAG: head-tail joining protein [Gemmatimonadaceae bacterium]